MPDARLLAHYGGEHRDELTAGRQRPLALGDEIFRRRDLPALDRPERHQRKTAFNVALAHQYAELTQSRRGVVPLLRRPARATSG